MDNESGSDEIATKINKKKIISRWRNRHGKRKQNKKNEIEINFFFIHLTIILLIAFHLMPG